MIFMKVKLDNFYCFDNSELDFTYPRKLTDSSLDMEYLEDRPNFRFKRVCILSGGNASGKTAFGKMLCAIQNIISARPPSQFPDAISNKRKKASFSVDFVTVDDLVLNRLTMVFTHDGVQKEEYISVPIGTQDSYERAVEKLGRAKEGKKIKGAKYYTSDKPNASFSSMLAVEGKISVDASWYYVFNGDHKKTSEKPPKSTKLLEVILKTFDQSVDNVKSLGKGDHRIMFKNKDTVLIDKKGEIAGKDRLSLGTFEAIGTTLFVEAVMQSDEYNRVFFLDESMAYSHSELEKTIINLLITKLSQTSQLFVTTHNYDILDMNLPVHSFVFLKKENATTTFIKPELTFKKNDRSLANFVQNDVFGTVPDTSAIDDLL